mgnify:CR=1 FL=1
MTTYNHAYTIAFEVAGSKDPDGEDVTADVLKVALLKRIEDMDSSGDLEWLEAVGAPFDSHEE